MVIVLPSEKCPEGNDEEKNWKKVWSVCMWPLTVTTGSDESSKKVFKSLKVYS